MHFALWVFTFILHEGCLTLLPQRCCRCTVTAHGPSHGPGGASSHISQTPLPWWTPEVPSTPRLSSVLCFFTQFMSVKVSIPRNQFVMHCVSWKCLYSPEPAAQCPSSPHGPFLRRNHTVFMTRDSGTWRKSPSFFFFFKFHWVISENVLNVCFRKIIEFLKKSKWNFYWISMNLWMNFGRINIFITLNCA